MFRICVDRLPLPISVVFCFRENIKDLYSVLSPSGNLLASSQFSVYVTGMKGRDKTLFGNKTITVQNVLSSRSYIDTSPNYSMIPVWLLRKCRIA